MNTNDKHFDPSDVSSLIRRNALFVVNHSGGKDSQAMMIKIREMVPADQIVVIHAELPGVEWEGTLEHAKLSAGDFPFIVTKNNNKTFFEMVRHRGKFPSPQYRQCTSDLKRDPINREIRRYLKQHPEYNGLVVNCMGMRAQESTARAKAIVFKLNKKNSKAGREWYDWLPIHHLRIEQVFAAIEAVGEKPHWAYAAGMSRLSCCFCIMGSKADAITAAKLNPKLYAEYVALEKEVNHTMSMQRIPLEQVTGIKA